MFKTNYTEDLEEDLTAQVDYPLLIINITTFTISKNASTLRQW